MVDWKCRSGHGRWFTPSVSTPAISAIPIGYGKNKKRARYFARYSVYNHVFKCGAIFSSVYVRNSLLRRTLKECWHWELTGKSRPMYSVIFIDSQWPMAFFKGERILSSVTLNRFWLDFGRRFARLPTRPSARPACTCGLVSHAPADTWAVYSGRSSPLAACACRATVHPSTSGHALWPSSQSYYYTPCSKKRETPNSWP